MTFRGLHEHSLDSKDRITVPSQYRGALSEGLVLMQGIESCVEVWPAAAAEAMEAGTLSGLNPLSRDARKLKRSFFVPLGLRRARFRGSDQAADVPTSPTPASPVAV